jgi:hypothetical protein
MASTWAQLPPATNSQAAHPALGFLCHWLVMPCLTPRFRLRSTWTALIHNPPVTLDGSLILSSGNYQSNLYRTLPNHSRLLELINIFDSEQQPPGSIIRPLQPLPSKNSAKSGFGANTSLHLDMRSPVNFLALPELNLLPALFRPIWDWCGLLNEDEVDAFKPKSFQCRISSISLSRTHANPMETTCILIAQLVLVLHLPSPHLSLLVYNLAFFSQVAMVHEENRIGMEDLACMFGGWISGGGQSRR